MVLSLLQLRDLMGQKSLAAYIIPTDDAHQSEYITDCDKRREFISGFTGSAGIVVVTKDQALMWTDGRYHLQASKQLDLEAWTLMRQGSEGVPYVEEWLAKFITKDDVIGFDPNLTSYSTFTKYSKALEEGCGALLEPIPDNLVDQVWGASRPPMPSRDLFILALEYSGQHWQDKVDKVREEMCANGVAVLVVTALDEVAWLFNMRGSDVEFNPVFFGYVIITLHDVRLYISEERTRSSFIIEHLQGVQLMLYSQVLSDLNELIKVNNNGKIWISKSSSYALVNLVPKHQLCSQTCPLQLLKGIKNDTEIQGMKNCHIRDSAALCEYLCWLENEVPKGQLNEVSSADKLESFRREQPNFVSLSFPTISSSGPNGAIIHYRPMAHSARPLTQDEIYLCDSGAQYLDGTTDVTRTVSFGVPTPKEKECFTLVLKGHIALCSAVFPSKTMGNQLDCLARHALWEAGLDYNHGTGHGVGAFLNVHEGPHGIGKGRPYPKAIQNGMFVTDEPGFYEDGAFGIRIENVELVKKVDTKYQFNQVDYLSMEPVTLVPIQQKMIDVAMLTKKEVAWLNNYHSVCLKLVGQYLIDCGKNDVVEWLQRETKWI